MLPYSFPCFQRGSPSAFTFPSFFFLLVDESITDINEHDGRSTWHAFNEGCLASNFVRAKAAPRWASRTLGMIVSWSNYQGKGMLGTTNLAFSNTLPKESLVTLSCPVVAFNFNLQISRLDVIAMMGIWLIGMISFKGFISVLFVNPVCRVVFC